MHNTETNELSTYIHLSKYSRWIEKEKRRETWEETVDRYVSFFKNKTPQIEENIWIDIKNSILNFEVLPSMRALMTAGKALEIDNVAGFNCSACAVDNPRVFDEAFFLLMCGTGFGFSVERQFIAKLPEVAEEFYDTETTITVSDSKVGWASSFRELISLLYAGKVPKFDFSKVRPAGARLKTFGGRASGYEALDILFQQTIRIFKNSAGRKLNSLECHDLICHIATAVICGSVRRSACISFSNLTDDRMRRAKTGEFYLTDPQRFLANNSTMYTEKPDFESFFREMLTLYKSKAGERGIVNQEALKKKAEKNGRDFEYYLLNPCSEAILPYSGGLCNLTEVVIRENDTIESLSKKVRIASIIGTIQSTLTDFRYLRKIWKKNAEEERLLGVSLTGIMDHPVMSGRFEWDESQGKESLVFTLGKLKEIAKETNREFAKTLGINESKHICLVKPSGTVSLLVNSSSGIHPRFSKYYIRRVTQDIKDPLTNLMIDQNIPYVISGDKAIFSFPIKSPENCVVAKNMATIEQLELWKIYQEHWCDGNPSQTIYYTDDSFLEMCNWVWKNWDKIGGLSFFPIGDHVYSNAPYQETTKEQYEEAIDKFPKSINWNKLKEFEKDDATTSSGEFACAGGKCEL